MYVSNHTLTEYLRATMPAKQWIDVELAYRFSRLIRTMIFNPDRVNYITRSLGEDTYTQEELGLAMRMAQAFQGSTLVAGYLGCHRINETIYRDEFLLQHDGVTFDMPAQTTFTIWQPSGWGCQIKSTSATTLQEFIKLAQLYDHDRERAWAMDVAGCDRDVLIGISKKNLQIFILPIKRGDNLHTQGRHKYLQLALQLHRDTQ